MIPPCASRFVHYAAFKTTAALLLLLLHTKLPFKCLVISPRAMQRISYGALMWYLFFGALVATKFVSTHGGMENCLNHLFYATEVKGVS